MHHKHRKPRKSRAGCKLCKPHKAGGVPRKKDMRMGNRRHYEKGTAQLRDEGL